MNRNRFEQRSLRTRRNSGDRGLHLAMGLFSASLLLLAAAVFLSVTAAAGGKGKDPSPMGSALTSATGLSAKTVSRPEQPEAGSQPAAQPVQAGDWKLLLVNPWNPLPEGFSVQTVTLDNGLQVDERCYPDLQAMMDACRAEGLSPVICSAYRTQADQESLYQAEVERKLSEGYSQSDAEAEAGKVVAVPGTSEHQLGLAVDIVDVNNQLLDESQEHTEVQQWLMEHSWEYGFILRYPNEKSGITGIIYEPWHYRYVGREDAERIHDAGVCLEEYLGK